MVILQNGTHVYLKMWDHRGLRFLVLFIIVQIFYIYIDYLDKYTKTCKYDF